MPLLPPVRLRLVASIASPPGFSEADISGDPNRPKADRPHGRIGSSSLPVPGARVRVSVKGCSAAALGAIHSVRPAEMGEEWSYRLLRKKTTRFVSSKPSAA